MPACPNCSHKLPRIENILLRFRRSSCPKCRTSLKLDPAQFALLDLLVIPYLVLSAVSRSENGTGLIPKYLHLSREDFIYTFPLFWLTLYFVLVLFFGRVVQAEAKPPFKLRLREVCTYQPMPGNFQFKRAWLLPIAFLIGLIGVAVLLIKIAGGVVG